MLARRFVATVALLVLPMMVMAMNSTAVTKLTDWGLAVGLSGTEAVVWGAAAIVVCSGFPVVGSVACGVTAVA